MKVGLIQHQASVDLNVNLDRTINSIKELAKDGAQVICTQELFRTQYFCFEENLDHFDLAESLNGDTVNRFSKVAKEEGVVLIASLFEERAEGIYHNTAVVFDADGSILGNYRKMHIPEDPGFNEKFYFTPGEEGYRVFHTRFGKIGVLICWDQWYPEAARLTALKGAEILFFPTAIGWDTKASDHVNEEELAAWQTIQKSHAVANGIPVVAVNRVGTEHETLFWGTSFVCNAFGRVLFEASRVDESVSCVEIDMGESKKYRRVWPFLRDRRIDSYNSITKRIDHD